MAKTTTAAAKELTIDDLSSQIALLKKDIASLTETLSDYGQAKSDQ